MTQFQKIALFSATLVISVSSYLEYRYSFASYLVHQRYEDGRYCIFRSRDTTEIGWQYKLNANTYTVCTIIPR